MAKEMPQSTLFYGHKKESELSRLGMRFSKCWQLYVLFLLPLIYIITFKYVPMYGAQIAFRDYRFTEGIVNSPWVGFKHFERFFRSHEFWKLIKNTVGISLYNLAAGFPFPIILAIMLNYARSERFKKTVQMVTYAPYFISTVVMVSMVLQFLSPRVGIVNVIRELLGLERVNYMGVPEYFKSIYVWSGIWQYTGYGAIIYLAALASIDPTLHEAAIVDGANKFYRVWYIDLPGILPTIVILLILNTGQILNTGFEKILLMQNPLNLRTSEVIDTFVYKVGLASQTINYSYPAAVGLFKSVVNLFLIVTVNRIAKKIGETSLW
ncbi:multiple sugar transport system permease protein/putative aldouronate transport system permease protein [Caldicoprobacter guelmensis]|uniref:ABC transporter permease n=1 Tax=Caldicoprobacter guelmensis TaxID=1170224 RepID=UPI001FAF87E6|nr:ABC transporter permease subunit [Caldicoprobacter guelmensis]MBM7583370.1 multiple sugar transport system permease protein/putative aldouronate transport system permease protein [Caldicoprobacter guelmensis]